MTAMTTWPDLITLLAALVARLGSPAQLAMRMLRRAEARALSRQLMLIEIKVRIRLDALLTRFASSSGVTATLLEALAKIAGARSRSSRPDRADPQRRQAAASQPLRPSFARLVPSASLTPGTPPSSATHPKIVGSFRPTPSPDVSALPLARRLAALDEAIRRPDATALRLLASRPMLGLRAGVLPDIRATAPAATTTPSRQAGTPHQPLSPHPPGNRRDRRRQKALARRARAPDTS